MKQFKYMRAFYGVVVSGMIAVVVTMLTKPESKEKQKGLVWGTVAEEAVAEEESESVEDGS